MMAQNYTDLFARARELAALPVDKRPGHMADFAGRRHDRQRPANPPPCPRRTTTSSTLPPRPARAAKCSRRNSWQHYNKSLADRKDVAFVSWPTDATTPPYLEYARQNTIPWPNLPAERKSLFANLGVFEIPGILVVDRFGNRLLATNQLPGPPLEAADATLAKLDGVLKP